MGAHKALEKYPITSKNPQIKVSQIVILTPQMKQGSLDEYSGKIWSKPTVRVVARGLHAP